MRKKLQTTITNWDDDQMKTKIAKRILRGMNSVSKEVQSVDHHDYDDERVEGVLEVNDEVQSNELRKRRRPTTLEKIDSPDEPKVKKSGSVKREEYTRDRLSVIESTADMDANDFGSDIVHPLSDTPRPLTRSVGTLSLPLHPNCTTTTAPTWSDTPFTLRTFLTKIIPNLSPLIKDTMDDEQITQALYYLLASSSASTDSSSVDLDAVENQIDDIILANNESESHTALLPIAQYRALLQVYRVIKAAQRRRECGSNGDILQNGSYLGRFLFPLWDGATDHDIRNNFWVTSSNSQVVLAKFNESNNQSTSDGRVNGWLENGLWIDPTGDLTLNQKQYSKVDSWKRIINMKLIGTGPELRTTGDNRSHIFIDIPQAKTICQGFVGDCSFLSSLAVLAEYERRFHYPVLFSRIYPQLPYLRPHVGSFTSEDVDRMALEKSPFSNTVEVPTELRLQEKQCNALGSKPVISPSGMYGVKLYFNGGFRKVLVDDQLPVRADGKILVAHSIYRNEFWVSILEKAFLKLMGGSLFMQGSNPCADSHHLTGWICETKSFRTDVYGGSPGHKPNSSMAYGDAEWYEQSPYWNMIWSNMIRAYLSGRVVVCLGTCDIHDSAPCGLDYPEGVSMSSGIVAKHAYSVLDMVEIPRDPDTGELLTDDSTVIRQREQCGPNASGELVQAISGVLQPSSSNLSTNGITTGKRFLRSDGRLNVMGKYSPLRLVKVKNPWGKVRWRGAYGYRDSINWTTRLQHILGYDFDRAAKNDDGTFWIPWKEIITWFSHLYLCWVPFTLFKKVTVHHYKWRSDQNLSVDRNCDDVYKVYLDPQFRLDVLPELNDDNTRDEVMAKYGLTGSSSDCIEVWISITRHVQERQKDLCQKYVAVHVYEGEGEGATKHIIAPDVPVKMGVYANGECYLTKLFIHPFATKTYIEEESRRLVKATKESARSNRKLNDALKNLKDETHYKPGDDHIAGRVFTVVISQYNHHDTFSFTAKAYCNASFSFDPLGPLSTNKHQIKHFNHKWDVNSAGGSSNDLWSYMKNPQILLETHEPVRALHAILASPIPNSAMNIRLFPKHPVTPRQLRLDRVWSSGTYRGYFCHLSLHTSLNSDATFSVLDKDGWLSPGKYVFVPSTFRDNQIGDFKLTVIAERSNLHSKKSAFNLTLYPNCYSPTADLPLYKTTEGLRDVNIGCHWVSIKTSVNGGVRTDSQTNCALRLEMKFSSRTHDVIPTLMAFRADGPYQGEKLPYLGDYPSLEDDIKIKGLSLVTRSDLEGGISQSGRGRSSASFDYASKTGSMTISSVTMSEESTLIVFIGCVPKVAVDPNRSKEPTSLTKWRSQKGSSTSGQWSLHVISDRQVKTKLIS
eukprot:GHVH01000564.1.p1 GENE.GHVH01000564.1~~GHVH01000564.1.p1  ORF type:complete len:1356 (+),score=186.22 GHVH01000564.1:106-4173(+)